MKVAIVNLGQIVSGDWRAPFASGDTIINEGCFATYRPGGMRVVAGSVILEPGLTARDFAELPRRASGSPRPALAR